MRTCSSSTCVSEVVVPCADLVLTCWLRVRGSAARRSAQAVRGLRVISASFLSPRRLRWVVTCAGLAHAACRPRAPLRAGLVTALLPCPCARVRAGGGGASAGEGTHGYVLTRPATALLTVCFSHSPANGGPGAPRAPRAHHACRDCPPGGAQASLHHPWV